MTRGTGILSSIILRFLWSGHVFSGLIATIFFPVSLSQLCFYYMGWVRQEQEKRAQKEGCPVWVDRDQTGLFLKEVFSL